MNRYHPEIEKNLPKSLRHEIEDRHPYLTMGSL